MSEKTEQPTPKKLREAREKGQVGKSQEVGSAAIVIVLFSVFAARYNANVAQLFALYETALNSMASPFGEAVIEMGQASLYTFLFITVPFIAAAPLAGILGQVAQVGFLFSFKAAAPSLDKLSPKQWFGKVFSKRAVLELGKTVIKVLVLGWIVHKVVIDSIDPLLKAGLQSLELFMVVFSGAMGSFFRWTALVFATVAAIDYLLQKKMHLDKLKMSKDEVKREYKEMEGDPQIKSRRRQMHQEMVMNDTVQNTRSASVLVTNPTKIAIALYYEDEESTPLPIITAMGEGAVAKRMREVAEEEGIPIMQNVPLARDLLEQGQLHSYIPSELILPVAEVMRWVNELQERREP
jgi:type III secretion protein, YscU/HrpY family